MSGLSSFSTACSEAMKNLATGFLCCCWSSMRQQDRYEFHPLKVYAQEWCLFKAAVTKEGKSALPHNLAFPGCAVTHCTCIHSRLNEKGLSVISGKLISVEYMEQAFPPVGNTYGTLLESSPLCSMIFRAGTISFSPFSVR